MVPQRRRTRLLRTSKRPYGYGNQNPETAQRALPLRYDLFYEDALVMKTLKSREIHLRNRTEAFQLRLRFDGFPYFGIWSAPDAGFVCLEPWCGIADSVHHTHDIAEKEGIEVLQAKERFRKSWSVTIAQ